MRKIFFTVFYSSIMISCNLGVERTFISGYSYYENQGKGYRMITSDNPILHKTNIYSDVIGFVYNDDFILAKQKPERSNSVSFLANDLYARYTNHMLYLTNPDILIADYTQVQIYKVIQDTVNYRLFHEKGASNKNTSDDKQISRSIANSLIENDPYYKKIFSRDENYWIIWNAKDSLIGPLTKEEYLIKRKELHIPDELKLE